MQSVIVTADNDNEMKNFYIIGSNDGSSFDKLTDTLTFAKNLNTAYDKSFIITSHLPYRYWRIVPINNVGNNSVIRLMEANFFGRKG